MQSGAAAFGPPPDGPPSRVGTLSVALELPTLATTHHLDGIYREMTVTDADHRLEDRIWREISQSASSSEIARGVSDLLAEHLAHDRFVLVRLDADRRRPIVVESVERDPEADDGSDDWTIGDRFDDLRAWAERPRTEIGDVDDLGGPFRDVCPWEEANVLVVSLPREDRDVGFAAARLSPDAAISGRAPAEFEAIAEPLAAALSFEQGFGDPAAARAEGPEIHREHYQRVKRRELLDIIMDAHTGLEDVVEWVRRVAPSTEPVLLVGETGTGKEVIARTIHNNSEFADGPLMRINCGALSGGVIETKLFGSSERDFTPATRRKPGWFLRADGGTLFLDEIDQLPRSAQRRLADWLETGEFERPGSSETVAPRLRLIAGNPTNLEEADGLIDELVEPLSTFPIHIPPLRARPEDIPALAMQFAERAGRRIGGAPLAPTAEEIEALVAYAWPGNVRELRSVIERAAIIGNGKRLHIREALGDIDATSTNNDGEFPTLDDAIRDHLIAALRQTDGQVAGDGGAADLLDLHPSTLRSKLKRHELDPADYR